MELLAWWPVVFVGCSVVLIAALFRRPARRSGASTMLTVSSSAVAPRLIEGAPDLEWQSPTHDDGDDTSSDPTDRETLRTD